MRQTSVASETVGLKGGTRNGRRPGRSAGRNLTDGGSILTVAGPEMDGTGYGFGGFASEVSLNGGAAGCFYLLIVARLKLEGQKV